MPPLAFGSAAIACGIKTIGGITKEFTGFIQT